ncbi:MAG: TIGR01906 family membrane protein [Coriobacteriia bacterium]|nr:TIGR01906 family membrane protein [Coriobacteriia bacterium]
MDRLLRIAYSISVAALIVCFSLMLMLLPPITRFWAERLVDEQNSAVSREALLQAADAGLSFVSGGEDRMPRGNDYRTAFTDDVVSHMEDVRQVFQLVKLVATMMFFIVLLLTVYFIRQDKKTSIGQSLCRSAFAVLIIVVVLFIIGLVNFDALFIKMHELLFADGTWSFRYDSLLITTYPGQFWIAMGATLALVLVATCIACIAIGHRLQRKAT